MGDVVGCGVHRPSATVFFTLNGNVVGAPCTLPTELAEQRMPLFMTVGVDAHDHIVLNAGARRFAYDPDTPLPAPLLAAAAVLPRAFRGACKFIEAASVGFRGATLPPEGSELSYAGAGYAAPQTRSLLRQALAGLHAALAPSADEGVVGIVAAVTANSPGAGFPFDGTFTEAEDNNDDDNDNDSDNSDKSNDSDDEEEDEEEDIDTDTAEEYNEEEEDYEEDDGENNIDEDNDVVFFSAIATAQLDGLEEMSEDSGEEDSESRDS